MTNFTGTIITLGGGGFSQEGAVTPIDEHILELTRAERPCVCFVPTASGDDLGYAAKFEQAFAGRTETSVLSLFTKSENANWTCDPRDVLTQDVVYVGGGSTANLLAIWRTHGLPDLLREAAANGTVLAGISAGMKCWFEASSTDSFGPLAPLDDGLGFLPGSACPHLFGEPGRAEKYRRWVADGALPDGHAADDGVALVWHRDTEYGTSTYAVTEKPGGVAWRVTREQGEPHVIPARLLARRWHPASARSSTPQTSSGSPRSARRRTSSTPRPSTSPRDCLRARARTTSSPSSTRRSSTASTAMARAPPIQRHPPPQAHASSTSTSLVGSGTCTLRHRPDAIAVFSCTTSAHLHEECAAHSTCRCT